MQFGIRSLGLAYDPFESDPWTDHTPEVIDETGRRAANELLGAGVPAAPLFIEYLMHPRHRYGQWSHGQIAISVYVLVAIVRKEIGVKRSLSEILQILSLTLFEKTPIPQALSESKPRDPEPPFSNQLSLFDL